MGSGGKSSYSGSSGRGSQPYAPTYQVVSDMLNKDKQDADIYHPKTGYFKNPTAVNIEDAIQGNRVYVDGLKPGGPITYVIDTDGNMIIGVRHNPNDLRKRCPHPTLIGGKNPEVKAAGMITFKDGKIFSINDESGHFRPNSKSLSKAEDALDKLYKSKPDVFHKTSKWRKK